MANTVHNLSQRLYALYANLRDSFGTLPLRQFDERMRKEQSGHLFFRQRDLTLETVHALRMRPTLFPDEPGTADSIEETQRCADAWLALAKLHEAYGSVCMGHYLEAQAQANQQSKRLLRQVIRGHKEAAGAPSLDHSARLAVLMPAIRALMGDQKARSEKRMDTRLKRKQSQQTGAPKGGEPKRTKPKLGLAQLAEILASLNALRHPADPA